MPKQPPGFQIHAVRESSGPTRTRAEECETVFSHLLNGDIQVDGVAKQNTK